MDSPIFGKKKQSQNEHLSQFSDKSGEKLIREETYLLKLEFYKTNKKIKCISLDVFSLQ